MRKEYINKDVYNFLEEECRCYPELWEEFGDGILTHTEYVDFWESLSEKLDCFRICEECGKPMIEGYVIEGCDTYCSDECLHKHVSPEQYFELYDNGKGDSYWTTWYEDTKTWRMSAK